MRLVWRGGGTVERGVGREDELLDLVHLGRPGVVALRAEDDRERLGGVTPRRTPDTERALGVDGNTVDPAESVPPDGAICHMLIPTVCRPLEAGLGEKLDGASADDEDAFVREGHAEPAVELEG